MSERTRAFAPVGARSGAPVSGAWTPGAIAGGLGTGGTDLSAEPTAELREQVYRVVADHGTAAAPTD